MALQLNMETSPIGIALPQAYIRISAVTVSDAAASVTLALYATEAARRARAWPIKTEVITINDFDQTASENLKTYLYGRLHEQDQYSSAADV